MDIKDLAGLSEPMKRLIEVLADGVGGISKPYLVKKNADAKAYEIKTISMAIEESRNKIGPSDYIDGQVIMSTPEKSISHSLEYRSSHREHYQRQKAQQNIEAIAANAAEDLLGESNVSPNKPDQDWISRFFDTAENISSEELQSLWGKILAGEIKQPGSFSLRTLDIIKNISKTEAELFSKLANFVFNSDGNKYFAINPQNLLSTFEGGLSFLELLSLKDSGLVLHDSSLRFTFASGKAGHTGKLIYGPIIIIFDREKDTPEISAEAVVLTRAGIEIMSLISTSPNMAYLQKAAQALHVDGLQESWAPIQKVEMGLIHFGAKVPIPHS